MDVNAARPKVSVIIATHNHAHFLAECLDSVRKQSYDNYEVIVVNNGSTDNTEEVVRMLAWDRLRYHYQNDTGSVAGPRNTGIRLALGEYVAFLDSDDWWEPRKLEMIMRILQENPEIDIASHDLYYVKEGRKKFIIRCGPAASNMFRQLLIKNRLLGSATTVKKSVMEEIGGFDESREFVHAEDYEAWVRIAYLGKKFVFLNEPLGYFRVHKSNLSLDFEGQAMHIINVIEKYSRQLKSSSTVYKAYLRRNALCTIYFKLGIQYFFRKRATDFLANISRSFLLNPFGFVYNSFVLLLELK